MSRTIIRIIGWIHLLIGLLLAALTVLTILAANNSGFQMPANFLPVGSTAILLTPTLLWIMLGVLTLTRLLLAWFCLRAAKDSGKAMPILIVSAVSVLILVIQLATQGLSGFTGAATIIPAVFDVLTFFCAVHIKSGER